MCPVLAFEEFIMVIFCYALICCCWSLFCRLLFWSLFKGNHQQQMILFDGDCCWYDVLFKAGHEWWSWEAGLVMLTVCVDVMLQFKLAIKLAMSLMKLAFNMETWELGLVMLTVCVNVLMWCFSSSWTQVTMLGLAMLTMCVDVLMWYFSSSWTQVTKLGLAILTVCVDVLMWCFSSSWPWVWWSWPSTWRAAS